MTSSYASIDRTLEQWARVHDRTLFREFAGREARFFYWSSDRGECFQVSLDPPVGSRIKLHVYDTETIDDREIHEEWETSADRLAQTLDTVFARVQELATTANSATDTRS